MQFVKGKPYKAIYCFQNVFKSDSTQSCSPIDELLHSTAKANCIAIALIVVARSVKHGFSYQQHAICILTIEKLVGFVTIK